jgi:hypothetical protein
MSQLQLAIQLLVPPDESTFRYGYRLQIEDKFPTVDLERNDDTRLYE